MIIVRQRVNSRANFGIANVIKEPFRRYGRHLAKTIGENAKTAAQNYARNPSSAKAAKDAAAQQTAYTWAQANPGKAGAIGLGANAALAGAVVGTGLGVGSFIRRRRTKNGKIVVEQVNRK